MIKPPRNHTLTVSEPNFKRVNWLVKNQFFSQSPLEKFREKQKLNKVSESELEKRRARFPTEYTKSFSSLPINSKSLWIRNSLQQVGKKKSF